MAKTKTNEGSQFNENELGNEPETKTPLTESDLTPEMQAYVAKQKAEGGYPEPRLETIVSGAEFWDFEKNAQFDGIYLSNSMREQDSLTNPDQKAGDIMGYVCEDDKGEQHIIGNSYAIEKGIDAIKVGDKIRVTFLGKSLNSKNQPVNRFKFQRYV